MTWQQFADAVSGTVRERMGVMGTTFVVIVAVIATTVGGYAGCGKPRKAAPIASLVVQTAPDAVAKSAPESVDAPVTPKPDKTSGGETLIVYVTGAVKRPGVYTLPAAARLYHAIRAAGGFKANAVTDALNLADRVQDGDQLCVPSRQTAKRVAATGQAAATVPQRVVVAPTIRKAVLPAPVTLPTSGTGDAEPPTVAVVSAPARVLGTPNLPVAPDILPPAPVVETGTEAVTVADVPQTGRAVSAPRGTGGGGSDKWKNPGDGVVHLNTATDADLQHLNRCGPAMSARILAYRASIGRFTDVKQLMDVKGVGEKTFAKWEPFLAL